MTYDVDYENKICNMDLTEARKEFLKWNKAYKSEIVKCCPNRSLLDACSYYFAFISSYITQLEKSGIKNQLDHNHIFQNIQRMLVDDDFINDYVVEICKNNLKQINQNLKVMQEWLMVEMQKYNPNENQIYKCKQ